MAPSALKNLRKRHRDRAERILSNGHIKLNLEQSFLESLPVVDDATRLEHRRQLAETFTSQLSPDFYGSPESLSLLDTLPIFIALSAAQNVLQGNNVTELWMKLAARYMTQAILEQYLVYGAEMHGAIKEGFAYGFDAEVIIGGMDSDELLITNLFWDGETEREISSWKEIRDEHLVAVR